MANKNFLTLKALIAIIFLLIGLQYLSLLQVSEKRRGPRRISLFTLDWGDLESGSSDVDHRNGDGARPILESLSEFLKGVGTSGKNAGRNETEEDSLSILGPTQQWIENHELQNQNWTVTSDSNGTESNRPRFHADPKLPQCPMIPPGLHGTIKTITNEVPSTMEEIEAIFPYLAPGGRFQPTECTSRHRVAIIVPYRDREDHLRTFLLNIHKFLQPQQLDYAIYLVEQYGSGPFNRAMLMNVGAAEALKQYDYQCFIFHDVDLLPEDDRNLYNCPVQPRHMSVAINSFLYRLPYDDIFGGVSAMMVEHFRQVNGFSNMFWGWGGEDDDMSNRLHQKKLYISRYPANIARYKMLKHAKDKANPDRFKYLYSGAKRMSNDGYNSLKYKRVKLELNRLYTWILVDLPHLKP